ncbi:23S rRNA (guanosine(2251)-2'-O)-methyltransferase RlmB [Marinicella sp. W31]|uniref:23S rRNA (guanosine(2251)-2'-O)-methyltransferase RlmB n=1 Tax=Marinicella sp. W31 TaxID=3023713 RepID=UPI003756FF44
MSNKSHWIFGIHAVESTLKNHPEDVLQVIIVQNPGNKRLLRLMEWMRSNRIHIDHQPIEFLDEQVSDRHQGIIAQIGNNDFKTEKQLKQDVNDWQNPMLLILDNLEDPRNLGACLRSADAAGVTAVIMTKNKSAPITAITRKTAAGAVDELDIYQVSNLARALETIKAAGIWVYGTDCSDASESLYETDLSGSVAIIMGNEGKGLRHLVKQQCDHLIHIPMNGSVQSLNVSVATGISLFEAQRQRQQK